MNKQLFTNISSYLMRLKLYLNIETLKFHTILYILVQIINEKSGKKLKRHTFFSDTK